ncbi:hypothetical protein PAPHI01_2719, partial [Pancytospora philotis]
KTAFQTRSGLYEYTRMPFGLMNAPAAFQRTMNEVMGDMKDSFVQVYLDDIVVYSKNEAEHTGHLRKVFEALRKHGIKLNPRKCHFFQRAIDILGYRVTEGKIYPVAGRVKTIKDYPVPTNVKELRSFLGLTSYCRNFIAKLAELSVPLTDMLKRSPSSATQITLNEKQLNAFRKIQNAISDESALAIPDYSKQFILITDASQTAASGILAQVSPQGVEQVVSFFSQKFSESQTKYSATQRELLAIIESIKYFKPYLLHDKFKIRTDHKALTALKESDDANSMLFRWSLYLSTFQYEVEYIKGELNPADALSRVEAVVASITADNTVNPIDPVSRRNIISQYHDILAHGSAANMIYCIKKKYDWPGLYTQVHEYVQKCRICLRAAKAVPNTCFTPIESSAIGELVVIDTVGPLPISGHGARFILTAVDHFSKLAFARAVNAKSAENVEDFILNDVLPGLRNIRCFLSDNGLEFKSAELLNKLDTQGIRWKFGSPYYPQTQGAVERFNDTLLRRIRKLSEFGTRAWDRIVGQAVLAYNNSFHRVIGCTPNELMSGKIPVFDIDRDFLRHDFDDSFSIERALQKREEKLSDYATEFEGSCKPPGKFKVGDSVLRYISTPLAHKLESRWEPGFTVKSILKEDTSYMLVKNGREYVANKAH